jgi:hypothetical protein
MIVRAALLGLVDTLRFMLFSFVFPLLLSGAALLIFYVPHVLFKQVGVYLAYFILALFLLIWADTSWRKWKTLLLEESTNE